MSVVDGGLEGVSDQTVSRETLATTAPADGDSGAKGGVSWNFALDLWLIAELVCLAAVVTALALTLIGRLTAGPPRFRSV